MARDAECCRLCRMTCKSTKGGITRNQLARPHTHAAGRAAHSNGKNLGREIRRNKLIESKRRQESVSNIVILIFEARTQRMSSRISNFLPDGTRWFHEVIYMLPTERRNGPEQNI